MVIVVVVVVLPFACRLSGGGGVGFRPCMLLSGHLGVGLTVGKKGMVKSMYIQVSNL